MSECAVHQKLEMVYVVYIPSETECDGKIGSCRELTILYS